MEDNTIANKKLTLDELRLLKKNVLLPTIKMYLNAFIGNESYVGIEGDKQAFHRTDIEELTDKVFEIISKL